MDIRERLLKMVQTFFVTFTASMAAMYVYMLIFGIDTLHINNITAVFIMSVLLNLTVLIFYSKKEISRLQMVARNCIHLLINIMILLATAIHMGWISPHQPMQIAVFLGLVVVIFSLMSLRGFYQSKKLADNLNRRLQERYKE